MSTIARQLLGVVLAVLVLAGCGDDGSEDSGDEASFCRLATDADPVAEADLETLERLAELAPPEIRDDVVVLVDLAVQVDEAGPSSAEALAIEFEVRFSDEYLAARRGVEQYQDDECRTAPTTTSGRVTTTSTTSVDEGTEGTEDDDV